MFVVRVSLFWFYLSCVEHFELKLLKLSSAVKIPSWIA